MRFCKTKGSVDNVPLILAIFTPLISRVHKHIQQSRKFVFIDSSSSFDDYNNPMFVVSISSAGIGLSLGDVVTADVTSSTINTAMTQLCFISYWHFFWQR